MPKTPYLITIVSHTHWDREWYRPFQEFRLLLVEAVDQVLNMLANQPGYHSFLLDGQTLALEDYLEIRPEREAELRHYIQEGRLFIGPWHILPDEFLVSPEATIRNLMLGAKICERFGGRMSVGYTPDSFGHIGQLPQILKGVGLDAAAFQRGLSEEPTELWWEAPDGTKVLTIYFRAGYGNLSWVPPATSAFIRVIQQQIERLAPHSHTHHLLLMNGTDHMLPQPELPTLIEAANRQIGDHIQLRHGTLPGYVAQLREALDEAVELPVVKGELRSSRRHHLLPGILSTRMWIKQRNHECETALERYAEPLSAFALLLKNNDRKSQLWKAWRYLMENHPHDSICGCSIDQVHEEMRTRFDWSHQIADSLSELGLRDLATSINGFLLRRPPSPPENNPPRYAAHFSQPDRMITVFNPASSAQTGHVELEIPWAGVGQHYQLLDDQGRIVRNLQHQVHDTVSEDRMLNRAEFLDMIDKIEVGFYQWRLIRDARVWIDGTTARIEMVIPEYHTGEITDFTALVAGVRNDPALSQIELCHLTIYIAGNSLMEFIAQDVPGIGYRAYRLHAYSGAMEVAETDQTKTNQIENEYFAVIADPISGTLTIADKTTGLFYVGLNQYEDGGERGDEYNYCPPANDLIINTPTRPPIIRQQNLGANAQKLRIIQEYEIPQKLTEDRDSRSSKLQPLVFMTEVNLISGVQRIDITTTLVNDVQDHRIRVLFPTGIQTKYAIADGHFDRIVRNAEMPTNTQDWIEPPQPTAPQRAFVAARDESHGLMLAVKGLPEYELKLTESGAVIAITLLRCVEWLSREDLSTRKGHAGPALRTPGAQCLGTHHFEYSIIPFGDDLNAAAQQAYAFNTPLYALATHLGNGTLSPVGSLVSLEPSALVLTAIKLGENSEMVVRFYNSSEDQVTGFVHFELPIQQVTPSNLLEEPIAAPLQSDEHGTFTIDVPPKRIITLLCTTGNI